MNRHNYTITPEGWLLEFLQTQKSGLTGHMDKAGPPFNETFWGAKKPPVYKGTFWWPFEQTAYHIDGMTRTAVLLKDKELLSKAENIIYSVIDNPDTDGYLGPKELKTIVDSNTRWAHVVFFRACLALYEYNHDEKILSAMTKHYLGSICDYSLIRNVFNVEIMLELHRRNKEKKLLDIAVNAYEQGYNNEITKTLDKVSSKANIHGVTYNEYAKLGALLYRETGEKKYLRDSIRAYEKMKKKYLLPGGCNSSSEYMDNNRYDEVYELCDISDMTWSLHYLAEITDEISYSDMIETCIFNAGIGSVTEDFRALQYFSCANQLIFNEKSSHCRFDMGGKAMTYAPMPFTACCPGNMNRFMPNYIMSLWSNEDDVLTARMYGPSRWEGDIRGNFVSVEEKTTYPFDLSAEFSVRTQIPFTLRLRIPSWCTNIRIDGAEYSVKKGFAVIKINQSTTISVSMDADILQKENHGGVYFTRGPLVYTLGMKGKRETFGDPDFPVYRIEPDRKWNYAVSKNAEPTYAKGTDTVWSTDKNLPSVTVQAREVKNWKFRTKKKLKYVNWKYESAEKTGSWVLTPKLPRMDRCELGEENVSVKLVPYGAAKVRMTVLPKIK